MTTCRTALYYKAKYSAIRWLIENRPDLTNRQIADRIGDALGIVIDGRTVAGIRHSRRYWLGNRFEAAAA